MTGLLDTVALLLVLLALAYALKSLLPLTWLARLSGSTPAQTESACGGGCKGCAGNSEPRR